MTSHVDEGKLLEEIEAACDLLDIKEVREALTRLLQFSHDLLHQASAESKYRYLEVLGKAYSENDLEEKAIECFLAALQMENVQLDKAFLFYKLGFCYQQLGDDEKAITYLERALPLDHHKEYLLDILTCLSISYENVDEYAKAISANQRMIQEFYPPKNESESEQIQMAFLILAASYWKIGEPENANAFFEKLFSNRHTKIWILTRAYGINGHMHFEKKDYKKAVECYSKAVSLAVQTCEPHSMTVWKEWMDKAMAELK